MKRKVAAMILPIAMLTACGKSTDNTVVLQTTLPQTEAVLTLSNCTAKQTTAQFNYVDKASRLPTGETSEMLLILTEGVPVLTVSGAEADQVTFQFAYPEGNSYNLYPWYDPEDRIDYILTEQPDGTLQYRIDTVTEFVVTVETENGKDCFLLDCRRDGIEQQF